MVTGEVSGLARERRRVGSSQEELGLVVMSPEGLMGEVGVGDLGVAGWR
jgi:hypothetical protein